MIEGYDWLASRQATERFIRLPGRKRAKLLDYFDQLARDPHREPEGRFTDAEGKAFLIATHESLVVTYHVDHAVKSVYILAIE